MARWVPVRIRVYGTQWADFQRSVASLSDDCTSLDFIRVILSWFRKYPALLEQEPFVGFDFQKYLDLKESDYPLEVYNLTPYEVSREKIHCASLPKNRTQGLGEYIPLYLRGLLERFLVLESDEVCSACDGGSGIGHYVFVSKGERRIVYECSRGGDSKFADGGDASGSSLTIATKEELRKAGLI